MSRPTMSTFVATFIAVIVLANSAIAAVYIVPDDTEMIDAADAIAIATVSSTHAEFAENGDIVTVARLELESTIKGHSHLTERWVDVRDLGGTVGSIAMFISDGVSYSVGEKVLAFLQRDDKGRWSTWGMALGKFAYVHRKTQLARAIALNGAPAFDGRGVPHREQLRNAAAFVRSVRLHVEGQLIEREPRYFALVAPAEEGGSTTISGFRAEPSSHYPPSAYTQGNFRWDRFDSGGTVTFQASGAQPGYDYLGAAQRALAAWTNDPNSIISYRYGGPSSAAFVQDSLNTIVFNSNADVPSGAVGYAKWWATGTHSYKGETFYNIVEGDVVIRSNLTVSAIAFDEIVTHEVGHTLGFRHSDQGTPASNDAVMKSTVMGALGANLGSWDREAAAHVYTAPTTCSVPIITSLTASHTITAGTTTTLSFTSTGATTAQWYIGTTGRTTSPLPGQNGTSVTVAPTSTTSYWVRVGNSCGYVDSATITVTVTASTQGKTRGDMNGDGRADVVWRHSTSGANYLWLMNGSSAPTTTPLPTVSDAAWKIVASGDFNGDGTTDLFLRRDTGENYIWIMGSGPVVTTTPMPYVDAAWTVAGAGDFSGDGKADIFWRRSTGETYLWILNGSVIVSSSPMLTLSDPAWKIVAIGDFDGDGRSDLFWRRDTGENYVWFVDGATVRSTVPMPSIADPAWRVATSDDYNADGRSDILWRRDTGETYMWLMNGTAVITAPMPTVDARWHVVASGDFDGDGRADVFLRRETGENYVWLLNGASVITTAPMPALTDARWRVVAPR